MTLNLAVFQTTIDMRGRQNIFFWSGGNSKVLLLLPPASESSLIFLSKPSVHTACTLNILRRIFLANIRKLGGISLIMLSDRGYY